MASEKNALTETDSGGRGRRIRKQLPFIVFIIAFGAYSAYLQFQLQDALAQLFLVRNFFQVVVAALVIATIKNVLGIRTLGTFAPAIVALAFLATGLPLGLLLLMIILASVLLTRGALIEQRIQATHRVAILVTMVSVAISSVALLGLELQEHELFFIVLFPILISAWMGEQYVEHVTRVGWNGPTKDLAATILAIIVSFFVMTQSPVVDFIMLNPLSWVFLVLLNWFLGTRVRLRLSERFRFWGPTHYGSNAPDSGDFGSDLLTIVVRNREYIAKYNPPSVMAQLGKDSVKRLLLPYGVPMARTYLTVKGREDVNAFKNWLFNHARFALKPSSGYGGEGILLVRGGGEYGQYDTNMGVLDVQAIEAHALSIVEGEFHDGFGDAAIIEELLVQDESLKSLAPFGLSDFRIICFLGFPVMAMMRIPTKSSNGKANLHLGAVAAGIQLSTGTIIQSILHGKPQPRHPDTGAPIIGRKIPFWDEVLEVAAEAQQLSGLGFAGVDVTLDIRQGPVLMEVNRRPGLEIQNANAAGLLRRLRAVEALPLRPVPIEERIEIVKELDRNDWHSGPNKETSVVITRDEDPVPSQREPRPSREPITLPVKTLTTDYYSGKRRALEASLFLSLFLVGFLGSLAASGTTNFAPLLGPHVDNSEWAFTMTGARELNSLGLTGKGITVCIVDSGIDPFHPDFARLDIVGWWDLVNFRSHPYDDKGHGTAMAGLIAADGALRGAAPSVHLLVVKALDSSGTGSSENVANGIHLCVLPSRGHHGADIISLSLGRSPQNKTNFQDTKIVDAVTWATAQGIIVVAAAGNDGLHDDGDVELPAKVPTAIAVGAVDGDGRKASFTSIGSNINQTDPNLKPELSAPGVRLVSTGLGAHYITLTGTSPAAALVSGILALVLESRPSLRPNGSLLNVLSLKRALAAGARKAFGQTLPHDPWVGYGIIFGPTTLANLPSEGLNLAAGNAPSSSSWATLFICDQRFQLLLTPNPYRPIGRSLPVTEGSVKFSVGRSLAFLTSEHRL